MLLQKSTSSALCVVPPAHVWTSLQAVRARHDKGFCRWPPHINLIYPFAPGASTDMQQAVQAVQQALASTPPLRLTLRKLDHFQHGPRSFTLWLDPESQELVELQSKVWAALPGFDDLNLDPSRGITAFTPHLSLGQFRSREDLEAYQQELQGRWEAVSFDVRELAVITRKSYLDPFTLTHTVPLGPPTALDASSAQGPTGTGPAGPKPSIPYIATVGPAVELPGGVALGPVQGAAPVSSATSNSTTASSPEPAGRAPASVHPAAGGTAGSGLASCFGYGSSAALQAAPAAQPSTSGVAAEGGSGSGSSQEASDSSHSQGLALPQGAAGWLFAYDSLMDPQGLSRLGARPISSTPALLLNRARLAFNHTGGACNLVAPEQQLEGGVQGRGDGQGQGQEAHRVAPGVHGMLHALSAEGFVRVMLGQHDRWPCEVDVEATAAAPGIGSSGSPGSGSSAVSMVKAVALLSPPDCAIPRDLQPLDKHVESVKAAAEAVGLDAAYRQWLANLPAQSSQGLTEAQAQAYRVSALTSKPVVSWPVVRTGSEVVLGPGYGPRKRKGRGGGRGRGGRVRAGGRGEGRSGSS